MNKIKLILLLFSFCLISCEKESSIQEDIIGKWYMPQTLNRITLGRSINDLAEHSLNAWNYSMMVTTNSNQSLIDRMSDPEGSVSITGTVNDEIKFMQGWYDPYSKESSVYITNYKWNMFEPNDGPVISVNMNNYSGQDEWGWSDYLNIFFNDGNYIEIEQEIDYSFDGRTLNIPNQTLIDTTGTNLTLGGILTYSTIDIPANTPTEIFSYDEDASWDYGNWTIDIQENGRWVEIYTWEEPYDSSGWTHTYTDSTVAEWRLEDDTIFVTYSYDDVWVNSNDGPGVGQGTWLYEIAYTYDMQGDDLTLVNEFKMCEDEEYCLEWFEYDYGLGQGSLEELKMVWTLVFSKVPPLRSKEFKRPLNNVAKRFPPYNLLK